MWGGRHYREGEGSKAEMVRTRDKRSRRTVETYYGMKRSEEDVRWYTFQRR